MKNWRCLTFKLLQVYAVIPCHKNKYIFLDQEKYDYEIKDTKIIKMKRKIIKHGFFY